MSVFGRAYGQKISGEVLLHGKPVDVSTIPKAMDAGLAYATEDRKTYGLVLIDHIKHNVTLANLEGVAAKGVVDDLEELSVANKYRKDLAIRCSSVFQTTVNLSGGNQQKVVLAKWLFKPDVCLELETFPVAPDRGGWMSAEELKARCKPVDDTVRAVKDKMRQASSERKSAMDDDATQRAEAVKMLRRKGNEREAYKIENGMTPWVGARKGGESYARTCETLRQMAKAN
jgi:ABC-type phosphate transport system ATPase subunit